MRAQVRAMEREYARAQLHIAVCTALQRIRALRKVQPGSGC
ncbi:hypothetical protein [Streptomyces sp. NPDC006739]